MRTYNKHKKRTIYHSNLAFDSTGRLREVFRMLGAKQGRNIKRSESQIALFYQWLDKLKDGTHIVAEYKILRSSKTHQQVKTHFGLLINTVIEKVYF